MEEKVCFADIEKAVYAEFCRLARDFTSKLLADIDYQLFQSRDKERYKIQSKGTSTVKTVFGEVEYTRRRYVVMKDGKRVDVTYLLDHQLKMKSVGMISETLAGIIVAAATQQSFRGAARAVSAATGQTISHQAVWNVIQAVGESIEESSSVAVARLMNGDLQGSEETPVLYEEADGVYLTLQGKDRKRLSSKNKELKVGIAYSGCRKEGKKNVLIGKVAIAGFYDGEDFHAKREARIRRKYNTDACKLRILNGDGADWITNDVFDIDTQFQLDRFHIVEAITRGIRDKKARKVINRLLSTKQIDSMLEFIETYRNSMSGEDYDLADGLLTYLSNNKDYLVPVGNRNAAGKNEHLFSLGTMENHNFTIITRRMKNNRTAWSVRGAGNLAHILAEQESDSIEQVIERFCRDRSFSFDIKLKEPVVILSNKMPEREGGWLPEFTHVPILDFPSCHARSVISELLEGVDLF